MKNSVDAPARARDAKIILAGREFGHVDRHKERVDRIVRRNKLARRVIEIHIRVEIRYGIDAPDRQNGLFPGKIKREEVDVRIALDNSGAENARRGKAEGRGRREVVAVVVGAVAEPVLSRNDFKVVLMVVGVFVFALRPLGYVAVITGAHMRRPAVRPVVVFDLRRSVVAQTERVPDFVRNRRRRALGRRNVFGKDIARRVAVPMERADVSDPARAPVPAVVAPDRDSNSVRNVVRAVLHELLQRRLQRRNVNVERHVIFADAVPDFIHIAQLGVRERRRVGVDVVRRRYDRIAAVPVRARIAAPVEVEIDRIRRFRTAAETENEVLGKGIEILTGGCQKAVDRIFESGIFLDVPKLERMLRAAGAADGTVGRPRERFKGRRGRRADDVGKL